MLAGPISPSHQQSFTIAPVPTLTTAPRRSSPTFERITCPVWGEEVIQEPVLIELIRHEAVQRLKTVLQHGITGLIDLTARRVTRYEHSVGAMLAVRRLGGSVEEQASALLHDVAHTALSHVADTAFGYVVHEVDKLSYLNTTTIPAILERHFGDAEHVLEETNYSLLERDAPKLCADRLDYGLRDCHAFGLMTDEQVATAKAALVAVNGEICMRNLAAARILAYAYMEADKMAWASALHGVLYEMAAGVIRLAVDRGIITKADLWKHGDASFWQLLLSSSDPDVAAAARRVRPDVIITDLTPTPADMEPERGVFAVSYEAHELCVLRPLKFRTIDPDVVIAPGVTKRLSELDEGYRQARADYIERKCGEKRFHVQVPSTPFDDSFLRR